MTETSLIDSLGLEGNELEAFQRYIGGEPATVLSEQFGIKPMFLYMQKARLRKKMKKKRAVDEFKGVAPGVEVEPSKPKELSPNGFPEIRPAKPQNPVIPMNSGGCPFFPSKGSNEIHRLNIRRIMTEPPQLMNELGTGLLANVDPAFDDNAVRKSWGGGRYEIEALNSRGHSLGTTVVIVPGRSKPMDGDEDEGSGVATPIFVGNRPSNNAPPALAELAAIIKESRESTRAQVEQMDRNAQSSISQLREGYQAQLQMVQQMNQQALVNQQMFFQNMLDSVKASTVKPPSFMEEIEKFKLMREMMGDGGDKDAMTTAIEKLPDVIKAFAPMMGGYDADDFEDEGPSADANPPVVQPAPNPGPQQAPKIMPQPQSAMPIRQAATELVKSLVASGIEPQEAKQLVGMGLGMIKGKLDEAEAKKKPAPVTEPQQTIMQPAPPSTNGHIPVETKPEGDGGQDDVESEEYEDGENEDEMVDEEEAEEN